MSLECGECERDLRGGHAEDCSRHPSNRIAPSSSGRTTAFDAVNEGSNPSGASKLLWPKYEAVGKEIVEVSVGQLDIERRHYADAVNEEAAIAIAYAMNCSFLAKLGPVDRKAPCRTCKGVDVHAANCVERFDKHG